LSDSTTYHAPAHKPRFYYGYTVVGAAFIIMMLAWGLYIVFGVFFDPLLKEFGWTRAMTSGAYSLSTILHGVLGIAMGGLVDRFGPRIVVTVCGVFLGAGYLLMSQVETLWQMYLFYGVIIGIGMSGLWVPLISPISRWFVARRSMMTGIVICGLTIGQLVMPMVVGRLIAAYDWRITYSIIGSIVLVIIVVFAQFLKRDPGQMGQVPYGAGESIESATSLSQVGYSLGEAVRTVQFWLGFAILFCFGYSAFAMTVHLVPHVAGLGISEVSAADVLAVNGGAGIIGNFVLGGIIGDRIGNRKAFLIGFALAAASLVWLLPATELWSLYLFAIGFGIALGSIGTSESPLVARLFGLKNHGLIYGVIGLGFTAGGGVGPFVTGYIHDITGSYRNAFLVNIAFTVVGFILTVLLKPTRKLGTEL
jgi:OFA family oxalate/formate antiporter-like MFS transporter